MTSPNMDKLAEEGIVFSDVYSVSGWTSPSLVSIFSSLFPQSHCVEVRGFMLSNSWQTPVEILKEYGWKTYAEHWTGDTIGNLGFSFAGTDIAKFLEEHKDETFFVWFHLRGPHLPYNPPEEYIREFSEGLTVNIEKIKPFLTEKIIRKDNPANQFLRELTEEEKNFVISLYEGEIRAQDDEVGKIMDKLKELGLWDKTIVVITADHGEELFEHGWVGHGSTTLDSTLYEEIVKIPLIIRIPGFRRHYIDIKIRSVDIMPILFDILGIEDKRIGLLDGVSPVNIKKKSVVVSEAWKKRRKNREKDGEKDKDKDKDTPIFASTSPCGWQCTPERKWQRAYMLIEEGWKLIYYNYDDLGIAERFELFKLPDEQTNIAYNEKDKLKKLGQRMFEIISEGKLKCFLNPPERVESK